MQQLLIDTVQEQQEIGYIDNLQINGGNITVTGGEYGGGIGGGTNKGNLSGLLKITGGIINSYSWEGCSISDGHHNFGKNFKNIKIEGGTIYCKEKFRNGNYGILQKEEGLHYKIENQVIGIRNDTRGKKIKKRIGIGDFNSENIQITGGSIFIYADDDHKFAVIPENENGKVYLTELTGLAANSKIDDIKIKGLPYEYGSKDLKTDEKGSLYLYLPEGTRDITVNIRGVETKFDNVKTNIVDYTVIDYNTNNYGREEKLYPVELTGMPPSCENNVKIKVDGIYGMVKWKTDNEGKLIIYLPEGTKNIIVTVDGVEYAFNNITVTKNQ